MGKKAIGTALAIVIACALVVVSCAPQPAPAEEETAPPEKESPSEADTETDAQPTQWDEPYKIGVSVQLTGVNAEFGRSCQVGTEIAADQINAQGGILGREVEIYVRDDKLDPDEGTRVLKEFIYDVGVDAFLLSPPNVCQIPQMRICKEEGILSFAQQGQTFQMLNDHIYPYYFMVGPTASQESYGLAKYVARRQDIKSFVTFAPDYSWGHENAEYFTETVQKLRPDIEGRGHFWPALEEMEFGSYITRILGTEADLVVTWVFGTTYIGFVKQAKGYGLVDQMDVLSWVHQDMLIDAGKDIPSGLIVEGDNEYWCNRKNQNPYYDAFEKEYVARRGRLPALGCCQHYDKMMTLMQGIERADSFDKDEIAKAIEGSTFMTLRGPHFMRPINHVFDTGVYFGTTKYDDELGYCTVEDVTEIPGAELMRADEEYIQYRKEHNVDFKPWNQNWWETLPYSK